MSGSVAVLGPLPTARRPPRRWERSLRSTVRGLELRYRCRRSGEAALALECSAWGEGRQVRRVLAVVDGSPACWSSLDRGVEICREHHALLTVAIVAPWVPFAVIMMAMAFDVQGMIEEGVDESERRALAIVPDDVGLSVQRFSCSASAAVRASARRWSVDVLVAPAKSSAWAGVV